MFRTATQQQQQQQQQPRESPSRTNKAKQRRRRPAASRPDASDLGQRSGDERAATAAVWGDEAGTERRTTGRQGPRRRQRATKR
ncbi:hypothetical protein CDD80_3064 [Ophiocordyceps camponoti-rufipedis]|uniref:Uncharacterized protein n=1 Tax=Ophiocordyceps camponoti-rufipedis TaxID=2004952 RepID=A0A2C5Z528_9HYPO|nr:hypothetical protein CDD80_3064 [Ophiocordyceps camponoti-rufipedis]